MTIDAMTPLVLAGAFAYLLGSIPFGILIASLFKLGDLRKIGSGNIGATNVLRTGNKVAAALTLLLDGGKGVAAVVLAAMITGNPEAIAAAGVMSVVGHCFPVSLRFRGGKGVATGIGVVLAMHPLCGVIMCGVWLVVAAAGRISSLAALCSCFAAPISFWLLVDPPHQVPFTIAGAVIALLSVSRHRANIMRLIAGDEPRIGK